MELLGQSQVASALGQSRSAETRLADALGKANAKGANDAALREAANEFEAVFLAQMLSPVFDQLETDGPMGGGSGEKMWRGLMVQEYGKQMSRAGGVGIADHVYNELLRAQQASQASQANPAPAQATEITP